MVRKRSSTMVTLALIPVLVILIHLVSSQLHVRADLTQEKRYSLTKASREIVTDLDDIVYVKVYLEGQFPAGFVRLKRAVRDLLDELKARGNGRIEYEFIDPLASEDPQQQKAIFEELTSRGLQPTRLKVQGADGYQEKVIFPAVLIAYRERELPVQLLENQIGFSSEEVLNHSIISLEYKIVSAIQRISRSRRPRVIFLEGNGELGPQDVADFANSLNNLVYETTRMNLEAHPSIPLRYDVAIIAKPTKRFSEKDKFKIDQYIMHGGKVLWLVENVLAENDSLRNPNQMFVAVARDLNLNDILFRYGVRVNEDLIQDYQMHNPIPLVVGETDGAPQTELFPWYYYPLLLPSGNHPIARNLDPVAARFAGTIDTVQTTASIKKTVLLHTSSHSRAQLAPTRVHLGQLSGEEDPARFNRSSIPAALLLEGQFQSVFKNRLAGSFKEAIEESESLSYRELSPYTRMIVISDGDVIRNEVAPNGSIFPLGYYRYTNQTLANTDFLLNCVEYLLDESGLMTSRSKEIQIRMLDRVRLAKEKTRWQAINLLLPPVIIILFGLLFHMFRVRKYTRAS